MEYGGVARERDLRVLSAAIGLSALGDGVALVALALQAKHLSGEGMWFNWMQRQEPYQGMTCSGKLEKFSPPSGPDHRWCMAVVSSCREMLG